MAYREVSRVEITEVIRQWQSGRGIRQITRSIGVARNTIRKYILTVKSYGLTRDGPPPTESQLVTLLQLNRTRPCHVAIPTDKVLEPWADQIQQWVKHDWLQLALKIGIMSPEKKKGRIVSDCNGCIGADLLLQSCCIGRFRVITSIDRRVADSGN